MLKEFSSFTSFVQMFQLTCSSLFWTPLLLTIQHGSACAALTDKWVTTAGLEQGLSHPFLWQIPVGIIEISDNSAYFLTSVVALAKICLDKSWYSFAEEELTEIVTPWVNLQLTLLEGRDGWSLLAPAGNKKAIGEWKTIKRKPTTILQIVVWS